MDADDQMKSLNGNRDSQTYAILGAAMEVHRELGSGFLESVYQDALEAEFGLRWISYSREHAVPVYYKGEQLGGSFMSDFVCYESVIVEFKAIKELTDVEYAQVLHYLKATGIQRALLINFGSDRLEYKRLVYTKNP